MQNWSRNSSWTSCRQRKSELCCVGAVQISSNTLQRSCFTSNLPWWNTSDRKFTQKHTDGIYCSFIKRVHFLFQYRSILPALRGGENNRSTFIFIQWASLFNEQHLCTWLKCFSSTPATVVTLDLLFMFIRSIIHALVKSLYMRKTAAALFPRRPARV